MRCQVKALEESSLEQPQGHESARKTTPASASSADSICFYSIMHHQCPSARFLPCISEVRSSESEDRQNGALPGLGYFRFRCG